MGRLQTRLLRAGGASEPLNKARREDRSGRGQKGMTLIETLIAISILSLVAAAFLTAMSTSARTTFIVQKRATAESLAKSQLEYIKLQEYDTHGSYQRLTGLPPGYDLEIVAQRLNPRGDSTVNDDGLQKIVITVKYNGNKVLALEGYKCFQRY